MPFLLYFLLFSLALLAFLVFLIIRHIPYPTHRIFVCGFCCLFVSLFLECPHDLRLVIFNRVFRPILHRILLGRFSLWGPYWPPYVKLQLLPYISLPPHPAALLISFIFLPWYLPSFNILCILPIYFTEGCVFLNLFLLTRIKTLRAGTLFSPYSGPQYMVSFRELNRAVQ